MSFYQDLTPYYDEIFPANHKQLDFIQSYIQQGDLLDVGAGTGNTAAALAQLGYHVTAIEPEPSMYENLKEKAQHTAQLTALPLTMQQCSELQDQYDAIYCIGNTLVHLNSVEEVGAWLKETRRLLRKDGTLIIQIVNIEKIKDHKEFHFPSMVKKDFTFDRAYDLNGEKIKFTTSITTDDSNFSNTISLLKLTAQALLASISEAGFQSVEAFSNFEKTPYDPNGAALIVAAR